MPQQRIIDCIGASDEDLAHLRLLLRTAGAQLKDHWVWGGEHQADLVIVDTSSLVGDDAYRRTLLRGVACAALIDAAGELPEGRFLRKPLRRDDFVALLNGVGSKGIAPMAILSQDSDFFLVDLGEYEDDADDLPQVEASERNAEMSREQLDDFEAMFKRDPAANQSKFLLPEKLNFGAAVEFTGDSTVRGQTRSGNYGHQAMRESELSENIDPAYRRDAAAQVQADAEYPLREYLNGNLLGGPARITLPEAPSLVLDPKNRQFHTLDRLAALSIHCRLPLRFGDWEMLTSTAMQDVHEHLNAHPYTELLWLDRYLNSGGRLAQHLDPGGRYKLTRRMLGLVPEFQAAAAVGSAMLMAKRLDEIARDSGVDLNEVFDVINAYELIGNIEWTPRERAPR